MTTEIKTIERIRASYTEKEITKFDELKELAQSKNIHCEEFVKSWLKEYEKLPTFIDEAISP